MSSRSSGSGTSSRPRAFEGRLKAELMTLAAERVPAAAPVRSPARRYRIPIALGAVAAAVAGLVSLPVLGEDGGASPAYGVSREANGDIWVQIYRPEGVQGTVDELRALGVPATAVPRRPSEQCPATEAFPVGLTPGEGGGQPAGEMDASAHMLITPGTVPPGHTLVLSTPVDAADIHGIGFGAVETAKVPTCVPVYSDPSKAPVRKLSPQEKAARDAKLRGGDAVG
ncbi:hypothetical protein ACODT5_23875 [Streptomyces sp. 5.8]|uniref:hypothetical protein n=1 Tax=Streptomyces sp. 5.8 TaxID=3406571 RepID=UPI003BB7AA84